MIARWWQELRYAVLAALLGPVMVVALLMRVGDRDELMELSFFLVFLLFFNFFPALVFGLNFHLKVDSLILSQPVSREKLWRSSWYLVAATLGGVALIFVGAAFSLNRTRFLEELSVNLAPVFLLWALSVVPWLTLHFQSVLRGCLGSLMLQCGILIGLGLLLSALEVQDSALTVWRVLLGALVIAVISLVIAWIKAREAFMKLQLVGGRGANLIELNPLKRMIQGLAQLIPSTKATRGLIQKEIGLQTTSILFALGISGIFAASMVAQFMHPHSYWDAGYVLAGALVFLVPIIVAAIAGGEERSSALASLQLTLPVSTKRQWWIKWSVSLGISLVLGMVLPAILAWVTVISVARNVSYMTSLKSDLPLLLFGGLAFISIVHSFVFACATVASDTLKGILLAVGLCCVVAYPLHEALVFLANHQERSMAWTWALIPLFFWASSFKSFGRLENRFTSFLWEVGAVAGYLMFCSLMVRWG